MTTSHPQTTEVASQDPEALRREIARTRADMDATLAQLEDRVSPSRIKDRQTDKVRARLRSARESVMGSTEDGSSTIGDAAHSTQAAVHDAPDRIEQATRGNPLAAGLIAFGVGALAGTLLPATRPEEQLASGLRDTFEEPVKQQLQQAGQEVKGELQGHAQQASDDVKRSAEDAAHTTQQEARGGAAQVRSSARDAKDDVQQQR